MLTEALNSQRYWIGVVSKSHVSVGVQGGFAQLCHGKSAPLRRMKPEDWLIYYSPRTDFKQGVFCRLLQRLGELPITWFIY